MKLRKTAAGLLSAVMIAGGAFALPAETNPFVIVSEAASKLDAPDNISATSDSSSVTIEWDEVEGADGYVLYRYNASKKTYIPVDSFEDTTCTVNGLKSGTTYRFKIAAYKLKKGKKAAQKQSEMIKIATDKISGPSNITGTGAAESVNLKWDTVKGIEAYRVYCMEDGGSEYKLSGTVKKNEYTVTGLKPETIYHFKVESLLRSGTKYTAQGMSAVFTAKTKQPAQLKIDDFYIYEADAKEHKLSQFAGKPIVVYFWVRQNPTAERDLTCLNSLYKKYNSNVNFLIINCEGKSLLKQVKKYIAEHELTMPMYYDWTLKALEKQGNIVTPHLMALNADGELVKTFTGALYNDVIIKTVDLALQ